MTRVPRPELIGHRGAPREHPENTIPSFERAILLGADGIELDVHVTADGVPVVHHDPALAPGGRPISGMTLKALQDESVTPARAIPTLESVLALEGAHRVYVELKGVASDEPSLRVIRRSVARPRCALHAFDHRAVLRARSLDPTVPGGILLASYLIDVPAAMRAADAVDVWIWWEFIDQALVDAVHRSGGRVIAWTVNSVIGAKALASMGVDGICTDDIPLIRTAVETATP